MTADAGLAPGTEPAVDEVGEPAGQLEQVGAAVGPGQRDTGLDQVAQDVHLVGELEP
ncbi:hypothetical protein [Salana multivorans]